MRILLIHQAFVSPQEAGGTRHFEFARYMMKHGHDFTIVASDLSYLSGEKVVESDGLVTEQELEGVQVLRAYTYPSLHRGFAWRIITFLSFMITSVIAAMRAKDVDIVMGTSPPIFQALSAWVVSVLRRRPFLMEVRDLWPEFAIDMGVLHNPVLIKFSRWLESFLYSRATHLVVNSPAYRDYLLRRGIAEWKICVISNGVDPTMFDPDDDGQLVRKEFHLDRQYIVTYAGALGMANDIPTILRAANHLRAHPTIHFLLVGDGKERNNLEALAMELELSNVTFTGARPKSDMPAFLAASDACVATLKDIPMFRTTYPNKVFDYMAAGRPTILGIDGVIREVVENANGGVFTPPGDDIALSQAVVHLAEHRDVAQAMGRSARLYVQAHFDRESQAHAFLKLTEMMMDDRT